VWKKKKKKQKKRQRERRRECKVCRAQRELRGIVAGSRKSGRVSETEQKQGEGTWWVVRELRNIQLSEEGGVRLRLVDDITRLWRKETRDGKRDAGENP